MTVRFAPAHLGAAALCVGLAAANLARLHALLLLVALGVVGAFWVGAPGTRLAGIALLAAGAGWWWGTVRLDALDRSPLSQASDASAPATPARITDGCGPTAST